MRKVKIITDSCADLSAEQLEKYDIDYARMSTIEDGKESVCFSHGHPQKHTDFTRRSVAESVSRQRRFPLKNSKAV